MRLKPVLSVGSAAGVVLGVTLGLVLASHPSSAPVPDQVHAGDVGVLSSTTIAPMSTSDTTAEPLSSRPGATTTAPAVRTVAPRLAPLDVTTTDVPATTTDAPVMGPGPGGRPTTVPETPGCLPVIGGDGTVTTCAPGT